MTSYLMLILTFAAVLFVAEGGCGPRYQRPASWCQLACEDGCAYGAKGCGGGAAITAAPFVCQDHCFEMCHPVTQ